MSSGQQQTPAEPLAVHEIARILNLSETDWEIRGKYAAKLRLELLQRCAARPQGKLILVTAITPTSHGEGKTVVSIGLAQALHRLGRRAIVTLRQPSLGPIFGLKGGATGGGMSQVIPPELINLHFTGDFHAITAAHNLLAAMIDSHIFHGNELSIDIDNVFWPRAVDMDDRALRHITVGQGGKSSGVPRETGFVITAASEVMAILALADSLADLRHRLDNIVIGLNKTGGLVRAADLQCTGAMMVLLHDAILPNLVQTTEHTPALVHAGPFANIAHGTCSVLAQKMALGLAEFVVNETGFAADLGAEKYFDIVLPSSGLSPAAAVVVASVRALAAQATAEDPQGFDNLGRHLANLKKFGVPAVVAINRFDDDSDADLAAIATFCKQENVECAITEVFAHGGDGALDLANKIIAAASSPVKVHSLYTPDLPLKEKIATIGREIYGAAAVHLEPLAEQRLDQFESLGFSKFPVCVAKTQSSFSDNPKIPGAPTGWTLTISDIHLAAGAGFVVAVAGHMVRMPGLGKEPQAIHMDLDTNGKIHGLH